jgi:hypothetical protein
LARFVAWVALHEYHLRHAMVWLDLVKDYKQKALLEALEQLVRENRIRVKPERTYAGCYVH